MRTQRLAFSVFPLIVAGLLTVLVLGAARSPRLPVPSIPASDQLADTRVTVDAVSDFLQARWRDAAVAPAETADDLTVLRRLSLALHGTLPSLEEIRRFESDVEQSRIERWTWQLLNDRRFADYFSVRLARSLIGAEGGQFILFRRDRFTQWLADNIQQNRPLRDLVREMIASQGLWTGVPATNYVTQAVADGNLDPNKLAGRTVRAFLGQRIDCAQCHNHPFAHWKQNEFEGLAACFGQVKIAVTGVEDDASKKWEVEDRKTLDKHAVAPAVPFGSEWWPDTGTTRERLAAWVTHPDNRRFERAMANRVWGLVFGRPWMSPIDDLPDPPSAESPPDLLDLLGRDFREHGYDLKRLVYLVTASPPFRLSSRHPAFETGEQAELVESQWAAFPLVRLRPEQMIGAMVQAGAIKTIDQNSHLITRVLKFFRQNDFVRDYGDLGEQEMEDRSGTIPQALLRMNGRFAREVGDANPMSAAGRIAGAAPTEAAAIETAYLCCLSRRPTAEETEFFGTPADSKKPSPNNRAQLMEDLFWTLFNSPEFCWNH